ncbi:MAG TPA: M14 family metallocarboxypeptidase [Verrucomicrobiae bacterium]|nr:M14 family metallocarboxypeptidase [Verrucomicrobiae bacterium]
MTAAHYLVEKPSADSVVLESSFPSVKIKSVCTPGHFEEYLAMQRLGKNVGRYFGDTIDIQQILRDMEAAAKVHGWTSETFFETHELKLFALTKSTRNPKPETRNSNCDLPSPISKRIYLSAGIHGDEPAGPLAALQLLRENKWPENVELWFCPCLNPLGFALNSRENSRGIDLNRDYLKPMTAEITAHIAWLERQPNFDLCLLMHEDWESHGFYLYEQNPENRKSLAEPMLEAISKVCPIDPNELIEGRPAQNGIIRPNIDLKTRPQWAEAFYLITHKTQQSYTLEAPSDYPLSTRVEALVTAVRTGLKMLNAES